MKKDYLRLGIMLFILVAVTFHFTLTAQTPPPGLKGQALREWLKENYYDGKHKQLGYTSARRYMYNYIDNNNNYITGVYSGYRKHWNYGGAGTNPDPINCEHTVPQSFFDRKEPMRSDIHSLFPAYKNWNSVRSNHPFDEINDNSTTKWMYQDKSQSSVPTSNIDAYSEYAHSKFEPREDHKGNCARAIFYFYTMYPSQAGNINRIGELETLYEWHLEDPVDGKERGRNDKIEQYQGNSNPYIEDPELVARAWGFSSSPTSGELFFSEYVEGSSYNKALEIANFSGAAVNLSGYSIKKQTNGSGSWGSELKLSGTLANEEVYVIASSRAGSQVSSVADLKTSSNALTFNGNDAVALFKNGTLIDVLGTFNSSSNYAKDVTLVRKPTVTSPVTSYNTNEWTKYSKDEFGYLGAHTVGSSVKASFVENISTPVGSDFSIKLYPVPADDFVNIEVKSTQETELDIRVMNARGSVVYTAQERTSGSIYKTGVDILTWERGIYFISISSDKSGFTRKLIVE